MRKYLFILLILFTLPFREGTGLGLSATTVEREQQFKYYWYAAKQAIQDERYDDALVLLEFCEALNPNDGTTLESLGVIYNALRQEEKALDYWRRAFEAAPRDQWYRYSAALLDRKNDADRKAALRVMQTAYRAQQPDVEEALLEQLLRLYMSEERWKEAIHTQDEIDRLKGYDAYSAYYRMRAYALWGKPKKALAEIDKYLEEDPTNVQFLLYRIDIMSHAGAKPKELFAQYERILEIAPYDLMVLNNYAYLLATHGGDLKKAEKMSQLTIQKEPNNPVYLDTYGWILHLQGQEQLAAFYLYRAWQNATDETREEIGRHLQKIKTDK